MSGTKAGGIKAAKTVKEKYGIGFYQRIGKKGGYNGRGAGYKGGFASDKRGEDGLTGPERAKLAGAIGGLTSRRGPVRKDLDEEIRRVAK